MANSNEAMREALEAALKTIRGVINGTISPRSNTVFDCRDKLSAALALPRRQCDVGTAGEQSERFMDFCRPGNRPPNCEHCKVYPKRMNKFWCQLEWAQMPCDEKGGAK